MTGFTQTGLVAAQAAPASARTSERKLRRRRISPQAGKALEILGHSIEYLTDEYVHEGGALSASSAQLEAVQILMALNRQIYFECPEVPTFAERFLSLVHLRVA